MDSSNKLLDEDYSIEAGRTPELLLPISRNREGGRTSVGPVFGADLWTAYELSWLDMQGLPQVAIGEFSVPCESNNIIESKSLKIYLNDFNQRRIPSWTHVSKMLYTDMSQIVGIPIGVQLFTLDNYYRHRPISELQGGCIDRTTFLKSSVDVDADFLTINHAKEVKETLYTHLLRTNCPVTNQPDWASLLVTYEGCKIEEAGLLAYIISYRLHQDFHERCVEKIFYDLMEQCKPKALTVCARYLRRGGIDINPIRSTHDDYSFDIRLVRQ